MTSFHGSDGARRPRESDGARLGRGDDDARLGQGHLDPERLTDEAIHGLARRFPALSAQTVVTRGQVAGLALAAAGFAAASCLWPRATMSAFADAMSTVFLASVLFRAFLAWFGVRPRVAETIAPASLTQGDDLPDYTVLVPLYREAAVVPGLVAALAALDYPKERLQVLLVVEADDAETVAAAERHAAPPFEIVRVPPSFPRTKPNSCVALLSAFAPEALSLGFPGWTACPSGPFVPTATVGT